MFFAWYLLARTKAVAAATSPAKRSMARSRSAHIQKGLIARACLCQRSLGRKLAAALAHVDDVKHSQYRVFGHCRSVTKRTHDHIDSSTFERRQERRSASPARRNKQSPERWSVAVRLVEPGSRKPGLRRGHDLRRRGARSREHYRDFMPLGPVILEGEGAWPSKDGIRRRERVISAHNVDAPLMRCGLRAHRMG